VERVICFALAGVVVSSTLPLQQGRIHEVGRRIPLGLGGPNRDFTYGENGRHPEEPQHAVALSSEEVLRLTVELDEHGCSHFEEMGMEHLPEYRGYLVGYLGGSLAPNEAEHYRKEQAQQEYFCSSVPV
jgi:hypothetical protein